ncbi:MAG TPA: phenylalanine--tRNA ligase subunit beta [Kosmotogaceae bacterium]|nr:MAG: Phenylalanine--tRNA ligase beta subunit [Thermotogales bacterium 46_20]HAA85121.1 phenylalanine--tRNA ligase subunit beta [Kosmotogaceae bacterium]
MRIPTEWLKEFIDVSDKTTEALAEALSISGTEVDSIVFPWEYIHGALSGRVSQVEKHPNSSDLLITKVDIGNRQIQIVTSDMTVKQGEILAVIPAGGSFEELEIRERDIRGVTSEGMFLSLEELRLEDESLSVFRFDDDVEPGLDVRKLLGFDEAVIEVELTPNRGDCLSVVGIARELSAFYDVELKIPDAPEPDEGKERIEIQIDDENCYRYTALLLEDVKVGPSPLWMKKRLVEAGLRPRNNVVDITNYVMLETGHPVHAFDFDRFERRSIVIRGAEENEPLRLLDKRDVVLEKGDLLITNGKRPVALAGIMGGYDSGIFEDTKSVLLEVAVFDPVTIRKTSRRLGVQTDSSYRFERGVDTSDSVYVIKRLADLMVRYAGARAESSVCDVGQPRESKCIHMRKWFVDSVLGTVVPIKKIPRILHSLGFGLKERGDGWEVKPPTYRHDIEQEIDLVEEIGRIYGYDRITSKPPRVMPITTDLPEETVKTRRARRMMTSLGFDEVTNYSFISPDSLQGIESDEEPVQLKNPISIDMSIMRPNIFPGLIEVASYNYRRQNRDVRIFEVGRVFKKTEELHLAILATGRENPSDYSDKRDVSFYAFKGVLEALLDIFGVSATFSVNDYSWLEKSCRASIYHEGKFMGFVGIFDKERAERAYEIKSGELYIAEVALDNCPRDRRQNVRKVSFSPFPRIFRDLSFLVPSGVDYETIEKSIWECSPDVLAEVNLTDVYKGKGIPDACKSITLTLVFESFNGTLKDEDVSKVIERVVSCVEKMGAKLRDS